MPQITKGVEPSHGVGRAQAAHCTDSNEDSGGEQALEGDEAAAGNEEAGKEACEPDRRSRDC